MACCAGGGIMRSSVATRYRIFPKHGITARGELGTALSVGAAPPRGDERGRRWRRLFGAGMRAVINANTLGASVLQLVERAGIEPELCTSAPVSQAFKAEFR